MTRILVDFNDLVRGGQVKVSARRAPDDLYRGQQVTAYDPDAELECEAIVADLSERAIYLMPLWDVADEVVPLGTFGVTFHWDGHLREVAGATVSTSGGLTVGPPVSGRPVVPLRVVAPA